MKQGQCEWEINRTVTYKLVTLFNITIYLQKGGFQGCCISVWRACIYKSITNKPKTSVYSANGNYYKWKLWPEFSPPKVPLKFPSWSTSYGMINSWLSAHWILTYVWILVNVTCYIYFLQTALNLLPSV